MNLISAQINKLPRYRRLSDALSAEIEQGRLKPGEAIPSETALATQHNLSVGTVRRAIDTLVSKGVLERQQGRGTFVRRPHFTSSLFRFFRFQSLSGERLLPESRVLLQEVTVSPPAVAAALSLRPGSQVVRMVRLRSIASRPVLAEEIWLPSELFRLLQDVDLDKQGPLLYPLYEALCGQIVSSATETLTAEAVSEFHGELLQIPTNSPVVVIERLARSFSGTPLELRRSRGHATDFCYSVEIR